MVTNKSFFSRIRIGLGRWKRLSGPFFIAALLLAMAGGTAVDRGLKSWSRSQLRLYEYRAIEPTGVLNLTYYLNGGVIGNRYSGWTDYDKARVRKHYPAVALAALFLWFLMARARVARRRELLGFTLLAAGAASNLWDSWTSAYVIDTIAIRYAEARFFPFNFADLMISSGAMLMLLSLDNLGLLKGDSRSDGTRRQESTASV